VLELIVAQTQLQSATVYLLGIEMLPLGRWMEAVEAVEVLIEVYALAAQAVQLGGTEEQSASWMARVQLD